MKNKSIPVGIINFLKKNWVLLLVISVIYFGYISTFLKPWNLDSFSLTDDGQVLMQNGEFLKQCLSEFKCSKLFDQSVELGTGRYRPTYWVIQAVLGVAFGNSPVNLHLFRLYILGYLSIVIMAAILLKMKVRPIFVFFGLILYFTNYSFSENYIRLGPNEPYQVLSLGLFSLIYLSISNVEKLSGLKYGLFVMFYVLTVLIKETSIAIIPTILLTEYTTRRWKMINFRFIFFIFSPLLIFILIFLIKKFVPSTISTDIPIYTSNYLLNPFDIFKNSLVLIGSLFNSMSPYLKLSILLLPLLFVTNQYKKIQFSKYSIYWIFFSIFFVSIMFPWKYLLDRYLLMGIFGLSIFISMILSSLYDSSTDFIRVGNKNRFRLAIINAVLVVIMLNLFSKGFAVNLAKSINYSNWYSSFTRFEKDQVMEFSKFNTEGVVINGVNNLNDWEFLYEIPIHLKYIYGQTANNSLYGEPINNKKYLFSRSSFDSYVKLNDPKILKLRMVSNKSYKVDQIDPIAFREKFIMKPVQTTIYPPLQKEGYSYYWEVRQINDK